MTIEELHSSVHFASLCLLKGYHFLFKSQALKEHWQFFFIYLTFRVFKCFSNDLNFSPVIQENYKITDFKNSNVHLHSISQDTLSCLCRPCVQVTDWSLVQRLLEEAKENHLINRLFIVSCSKQPSSHAKSHQSLKAKRELHCSWWRKNISLQHHQLQ